MVGGGAGVVVVEVIDTLAALLGCLMWKRWIFLKALGVEIYCMSSKKKHMGVAKSDFSLR